jgi:hypothetical protein
MNFLPLTCLVNKRNTNTSLGGLLGERGENAPRLPSSETDYRTASLRVRLSLLRNHDIFGFPLRITGTSADPELVKPHNLVWTLVVEGVITEPARTF